MRYWPLLTLLLVAGRPANGWALAPDGCASSGGASVGGGSVEEIARAAQGPQPGLFDCPHGEGFHPLPSSNPAEVVFVNYWAPYSIGYIRGLAEGLSGTGVKLQVLAPAGAAERVTGEIGVVSGTEISVLPVPAPAAMWTQDIFALGVMGDHATPAAIGLQPERQGPLYGEAVAQAQGLPGLAGVVRKNDGARQAGGDLIGFPGGVTVVGASSRDPRGGGVPIASDALEVPTAWLKIGDADELFTTVPTGSGAGPCDFAILYASPAEGLKLLQRLGAQAPSTPLEPSFPGPDSASAPSADPSDCLRALPSASAGDPANDRAVKGSRQLQAGEAAACGDLTRANEAYEEIIQQSLARIRSEVAARTGCSDPRAEGLPILFRPQMSQDQYGVAGDAARAINPNPVNSLVVGKTVIIPQQPNPLFQQEVETRLTALGIHPHSVDAWAYHFNAGTVHCSTNALRTCR